MITEQDVMQRWDKIQQDEERILFVVGGPGSGKSRLIRTLAEQEGWKYIPAKELIDEDFLEVAHDLRPQMAEDQICKVLKACGSEVVLIDDVDVLFAPILNIQPIELLRTISRIYPLVVGWRGRFDGEQLYLEHNNDPEYYTHKVEYKDHVLVVG